LPLSFIRKKPPVKRLKSIATIRKSIKYLSITKNEVYKY